jgi:hypothetical protein
MEWSDERTDAEAVQDRWRYFGFLVGLTIIAIGSAHSEQWSWWNLLWLVGAGLAVIVSATIGRLIYRRRSSQ